MTVQLRCPICGLPYAKLEDMTLVVESRHHGDVHVNRISLDALVALGSCATEAEAAKSDVLQTEQSEPHIYLGEM